MCGNPVGAKHRQIDLLVLLTHARAWIDLFASLVILTC